MSVSDTFGRVLERADVAQASRVRRKQLELHIEKITLAILGSPLPAARVEAANEALGWWLSAAQEDASVCPQMKAAIDEWFAALEYQKLFSRLGQLMREARAEIATEANRERGYAEEYLKGKWGTERKTKRQPKGQRHGTRRKTKA